MVRIVKKHEERRDEILNAAQAMFYKNGYENTSVADIINEIDIAKGTFYHYFKSKAELLDQIIDRVTNNIDTIIEKVLEEPEENAIVELNNMFQETGLYKAKEKSVLVMMIRAIYDDSNIILRTKMTKRRIKTVAPSIAKVISRGISEGLFNTCNPDYVAEFILHMSMFLGDKFAELVLEDKLNDESKNEYLEICDSFDRAVERILGVEKGVLQLYEKEIVTEFFK